MVYHDLISLFKLNNYIVHSFFPFQCEMRRRTIDLLPELTQHHINLLDELVLSIVNQYKMPDDVQKLAHSAWQNLNNIGQSKFKGVLN